MADMHDRFLSGLLRSFGKISKKNPIGRSLSQCYAHALETEPILFDVILGKPIEELIEGNFYPNKLKCRTEEFRDDRRPDISVIYDDEEIACVEVKVEDQGTEFSNGQLKAYVKYANAKRIPFFYITQYALYDDEKKILKLLKNKHLRRHSEIAAKLRQQKKSEIAQMIAGYLEAQHMNGYEQLNYTSNELLTLVRRFLPTGYEGHAPQNAASKMAEMVERFFSNSKIIGEWLRDKNKKTFVRPFYVYPEANVNYDFEKLFNYYDQKKKRENLDEYLGDLEYDFTGKYWEDGELFFCVEGKMKTTPHVYLTVSFEIALKKKNKRTEQSIIAEFYSSPIKNLEDKEWPYATKTIPLSEYKEKDIRRELKKLRLFAFLVGKNGESMSF